MPKCLECDKDFKNDAGLHRHIRVHKMMLAAYYQKHFPRYDIYDKTLIRFKSKEYYLTTDFNSRANLRLWLEKASKSEVKKYLSDYFIRRKERKKLIYAPTQVELRSLPVPGMKYLNNLFGSYYQFCASLGLEIKYTKPHFYLPARNISKFKIIIDTRERLPLKFKLKTKVDTLPFGDYKLDSDITTCDCYIERKSIPDLFGTLTSGYDRFKREIYRSKEAGANMVVVVEGSIDSVYQFPYLRQVFGKVKISPEFVFHGMRELIQEFPNIQFLFVNNRDEASRVIEKIFACNCEYKEVDLQFAYDLGDL
jgi:hypothetical protein